MPFSFIDWQPPDASSTTAASSLPIVANMEVLPIPMLPVSSFFIVHLLLSLAAARYVPLAAPAPTLRPQPNYFIFHFMQTVSDNTMSRNDVTDPVPSSAEEGVAKLLE